MSRKKWIKISKISKIWKFYVVNKQKELFYLFVIEMIEYQPL